MCVCTHNPRTDVFARVLAALARQTIAKSRYRVWIIDNASSPPLVEDDMGPLRDAGVAFRVVSEPLLGVVHARARAIRETSAEWVVFVDDDTELFDDYLSIVVSIADANPRLGCFGGKLLAPPELRVERWVRPLLMYVAIKDCGDDAVTRCVDGWGIWEPPTAGAAVSRQVLNRYLDALTASDVSALGRKGTGGLYSGEDSLMMRGAYHLGLDSSYQPRLKLWHRISPGRLRFPYLIRLIFFYGRSHVILERALGRTIAPTRLRSFLKLLVAMPRSRERLCKLAWRWGYCMETLERRGDA